MRRITTRLGIRSIKSNKQSSIITVISIALSVALTTMVLAMTLGVKEEAEAIILRESEQETFTIYRADDPQKVIDHLADSVELYVPESSQYDVKWDKWTTYGFSFIGTDIKKAYEIQSDAFKETYPTVDSLLVEGRFSENNLEIVLRERDLKGLALQLGDTIQTIEYYRPSNSSDSVEERVGPTLTVVGTMRSNLRSYYHFDELSEGSTIHIKVKPETRNIESTMESIGFSSNYGYCNSDCISYNQNYNSVLGVQDKIPGWIYVTYVLSGALIFIMSLATFSLIFNAFNIAVEKQLQNYGLLRSVGATRKQIRSIIWTESYLLAFIAIVSGTIIGMIMSYAMSGYLNSQIAHAVKYYGFTLKFNIYPKMNLAMLGLIVLISFAIVSVPLQRVITRLFKQTSIEAIREAKRFKKRKPKQGIMYKIDKKMTTLLAYKTSRQDKRRYRGIKTSLMICIIVFVSLMSIMNIGFQHIDTLKTSPFDIVINASQTRDNYIESIDELKTFVEGAPVEYSYNEMQVIYRSTALVDKQASPLFKDYEKIIGTTEIGNVNLEVLLISDALFESILGTDTEVYPDNGGILYNVYDGLYYSGSDERMFKGAVFDIEEGATIALGNDVSYRKSEENYHPLGEGLHSGYEVSIVKILKELPIEIESSYNGSYSIGPIIILPLSRLEDVEASFQMHSSYFGDGFSSLKMYLSSDNNDKLETYFDQSTSYHLNNTAKTEGMMRWVKEVLQTILTVLIGFTVGVSVLNMISVSIMNMNMRRRELAALKSVGMTQKEMNRMLMMESIMMLSRPVLFGMSGGVGLSYLMTQLLNRGSRSNNFPFKLDIQTLILSLLFVIIVIALNSILTIRISKKNSVIEDLRQN